MSEGRRIEFPFLRQVTAERDSLPSIAMKVDPELGAALLGAARAAYRTGDQRLGEAMFTAAQAAGADERVCRQHLARIYNVDRNWAKALEHWRWLSDTAPGELEPQLQVARAHFRLANYKEAEESFTAVLALSPDHEEANRHLVLIEKIRDEKPASDADEIPSALSLEPAEMRWQLASEMFGIQLRALETVIEGAREQADALSRSVASLAEADGAVSNHRQLYGLQASRHTTGMAEQLKAAQQQLHALAERTTQIFQTIRRVAGDATTPDLDPTSCAILKEVWREIAVGTAKRIYDQNGFDIAALWLMTIAAGDRRARLLEEFGDAVLPARPDDSVRAWRLALGLARSPEAAERISAKIAAPSPHTALERGRASR